MDLLEKMLAVLGFNNRLISQVMECVKSVRYNVFVGADVVGPIILQRGLRQDGPLSPFLFILAVEGLTAMIRKKERAGLYHGCKIANSAPSITYLFFVDDAFLFSIIAIDECILVKQMLQVYGGTSG